MSPLLVIPRPRTCNQSRACGKTGGANILTVGACLSACHGNEPGTLKEVVSLNTGGNCVPLLGMPTVITELGFTCITGAFGLMNKQG